MEALRLGVADKEALLPTAAMFASSMDYSSHDFKVALATVLDAPFPVPEVLLALVGKILK